MTPSHRLRHLHHTLLAATKSQTPKRRPITAKTLLRCNQHAQPSTVTMAQRVVCTLSRIDGALCAVEIQNWNRGARSQAKPILRPDIEGGVVRAANNQPAMSCRTPQTTERNGVQSGPGSRAANGGSLRSDHESVTFFSQCLSTSQAACRLAGQTARTPLASSGLFAQAESVGQL